MADDLQDRLAFKLALSHDVLGGQREMKRTIWIILGLLSLMAACTNSQQAEPNATTDQQAAQATLLAYFDALAGGDYVKAAGLYGGDYEVLVGYNPDVDPADRAMLLERACTTNGFVCLPVKDVSKVEPLAGDLYRITVQFETPEGEVFVRGPCCGEDDQAAQTQSEFDFQVKLTGDNQYLVLDLPVYTP